MLIEAITPAGLLPVGHGPIFLVDDDPLDRHLACRCHTRSGIRRPLRTFDSGASILQQLTRVPDERPALVLVDAAMPDMHGFEVVRRMRAIETFSADTPIALLATCRLTLDRGRARAVGCTACLAKPGGIAALTRAFETWGP